MSIASDVVMPNDLSDLCRVCLQLPGETECLDLTTIYDEEENLTYGECFTICTQIDLSEGDNLPRNLCRPCGLELQVSYDFYKKIEDAKRTLEQYKQEIGEIHCKTEGATTIHEEKNVTTLQSSDPMIELSQSILRQFDDDDDDDKHIVHTPKAENDGHISEPEYLAISQSSEPCELGDMVCEEDDLVGELTNDDGLEQTEDDSLVMEEHLDIDDYQSIEALDDEVTETEALQMKTAENVLPQNLIEIGSNEKYLYEEDSDVEEDNETQQTHTNTDDSQQEDPQNWQENVVTVANTQHIPLETESMSEKKDKNGVELAYEVLQSAEEYDDVDAENNGKTKTAATGQPRKRRIGAYTCEYCLKVYPNYSRMANHRRCHEADRPKYPCEFCARIYSTKQAMECHVQTEHDKTGFTCAVCNKVFAIRRSLEVHMRFHNGDFPYQCDMCDKKFAQLCHLNTHKNVKHNNVRFACDYPDCGKFFTSSSSLRNHEFSHGIMPFECEYCNRGYPAKAKLKIHIKRKHGMDLSKEQLENMRKFHVVRSKVNLVKLMPVEQEL